MGGHTTRMLLLLPFHMLHVPPSSPKIPLRINVSYPLDQLPSSPSHQPSHQWFGRPNLPWLLR